MDEKKQQQKVNQFEDITIKMRELYDRKNRDYGDSFSQSFKEWGLPMSCIRLGDKLNRLSSLAKGQKMLVEDESVTDTLMDIANYAVMTIMAINENKEDI